MSPSMRDPFLDEIYTIMKEDRRVMLISNDFGAPSLDRIREELPEQFVHIGIAEQNMVDVAAGLALAGKIVYLYSIAPFLPLRCYEQMRVHMGFKKFHITGVAVGTGFSYDLSGPSHHGLEDIALMNAIPGMTIYSPADSVTSAACARLTYENSGPYYLRFDREGFTPLYETHSDFSDGLTLLKEGKDVIFVATGIMVHHAFKAADELARHGIDAGIIDLYRIKPLNRDLLLEHLSRIGRAVTLEENFLPGGIGNIVSGAITESGSDIRLKQIGMPNEYFAQGGGRDALHRLTGLDVTSITKSTIEWMKRR